MSATRNQPCQTSSVVYVGVDWADKEHAFHAISEQGVSCRGAFNQCPEAIEEWMTQLRQQFPQHQLWIVLEQTKGALMAALLKYEEIRLYPINPGQLASYRNSMNYGGNKNDPTDAELLAQFLQHYSDKLRQLTPESPATRQLSMLAEHRRRLVDQRTALGNELTAVLKQYYPLLIELGAAKAYARFLCELLLRWPSLERMQRAHQKTIRQFLIKQNVRRGIEEKLAKIADAIPLTNDQVLISCHARRAQTLARSILVLSDAIRDYDDELKQTLAAHEDRPIFASFPGAAVVTQSRLIAAFGSRRERYTNAAALQSYSGIAPVTKQSGRLRLVEHRWACPNFLKQTFQEYAGISIQHSVWAKAYYRMQVARGKQPSAAKRALAYKWQRIMFRCWQDRTPYDEQKYIQRLISTNSPLLDYIAA